MAREDLAEIELTLACLEEVRTARSEDWASSPKISKAYLDV